MTFVTKQNAVKSARSWGVLGLLLALAVMSGYGPQDVSLGQEPRQPALSSLIALPPVPPLAGKLAGLGLTHPDQLDEATQKLGAPARLMNFHLATPMDFSAIPGLGKAVYIPIQIARRDGGRPSLYFLSPGEKTLAGIFMVGNGLLLRYITRVSGRGVPAQTGDVYIEEWTNREGQLIFKGEGTLEVTEPKTGSGQLSTSGPIAGLRIKIKCKWINWSQILDCEIVL